MLIASTPNKDQYMDWIRLVESKIRLLIHVLEKNQYINLVHINPQGYENIKETQLDESSSDHSSSDTTQTIYNTYWFIGLEFRLISDSTVDLDLTRPIQDFTDRGFSFFINKRFSKILF